MSIVANQHANGCLRENFPEPTKKIFTIYKNVAKISNINKYNNNDQSYIKNNLPDWGVSSLIAVLINT